MIIKQALLTEHSKSQTMRIVDFVGEDKLRLKELMHCFFSDDLKVSQRAAWCVSHIGIAFPENIYPYLNNMISLLNKDVHNAIKRNVLRMLSFIEIPKRHYGKLINSCFQILISKDESIAVKVFSMSVLEKLSKDVPEIRNELRLILKEQIPFCGNGFKSRANKILAKTT